MPFGALETATQTALGRDPTGAGVVKRCVAGSQNPTFEESFGIVSEVPSERFVFATKAVVTASTDASRFVAVVNCNCCAPASAAASAEV